MRWIANFALVSMALLVFAGCGDNGNGNGEGPVNGTQSSDECLGEAATGQSCEEFDECPHIRCFCTDGESEGNVRACSMGSCADPAAFCPSECDAFDAGDWLGECESTD